MGPAIEFRSNREAAQPLVPVELLARTLHQTVPGDSCTVGVAKRFTVAVVQRTASKELVVATWTVYDVAPATRFQASTGVPLTGALAACGVRPPGAAGAAAAGVVPSSVTTTMPTRAAVNSFLARMSAFRR
jgi:hypothetical protein